MLRFLSDLSQYLVARLVLLDVYIVIICLNLLF